MKYDCRKEGRDPAAGAFPCNVRVIDPQTGAAIPDVFFLDTSPATVGRFLRGPAGLLLVDPKTRRKVRDKDRVRVEYDRLDVWEFRPWVAVRVDGGGVVAKSEGTP